MPGLSWFDTQYPDEYYYNIAGIYRHNIIGIDEFEYYLCVLQ